MNYHRSRSSCSNARTDDHFVSIYFAKTGGAHISSFVLKIPAATKLTPNLMSRPVDFLWLSFFSTPFLFACFSEKQLKYFLYVFLLIQDLCVPRMRGEILPSRFAIQFAKATATAIMYILYFCFTRLLSDVTTS